MKKHSKFLTAAVAALLILMLGTTVFAASYSGNQVFPGLSGILPGDSLTLPYNTVWATLTASWGVRVTFVDWDKTELQTELIPVTDSTPGSTAAPADPSRSGYVFTGWKRNDSHDGTATLGDDGSVTGIDGPGPIVFIATYAKVPVTGDETNLLLPVLLFASSGAALLYTGFRSGRRRFGAA